MTSPLHLRVPLTIIGYFTYVPVDFYKIVLTDPNYVSVTDNDISISIDGASASTRIANPAIS